MKEGNPNELLLQNQLPELAQFVETKIAAGEAMDIALATTPHRIHLLASAESAQAALAYRAVLGRDASTFRITVEDSPIHRAIYEKESDDIVLTMYSATNRELNVRMFGEGPVFGQLLMTHIYTPPQDHESPNLHCVGATTHALRQLEKGDPSHNEAQIQEMERRRREIMGDSLTNEDFRKVLRSRNVRKVIAHALGPEGTNIAQAMRQYVKSMEIEDKTDIIVHPKGIEPLAYAEIARSQIAEGVVPIHMECAVYYDEGTLFDSRRGEIVLADHHNMDLDAMQLASLKSIEELTSAGVINIATHPSPKPLIMPWVNSQKAEWVKATSNSAAAQMVLESAGSQDEDRIDACVTTGSGLDNAPGLISRHVFGKPNMLFTIATPLSQRELRSYMK